MSPAAADRPLNLVLVGYGEQARRFYHPTLERLSALRPVRLRLVIDLADRADAIRGFLAHRRLQPDRVLLLDPVHRRGGGLAAEAAAALADLHDRGQLDRLLVITEPTGHKPYVLWGARRSVDVLCEKPLTAVDGLPFDEDRAWRLYGDYLEVAEAVRAGRVVLMAPRRLHAGFRTVVGYLRDFLDRFEVPVTYVDGYHAEGVWNLPDEFLTRQNHPYQHGYGKLLHAGYHYVELVSRVASLNDAVPGMAADRLELAAQSTRPWDFFAQFDAGRYRHLMGTDRFDDMLGSDAAAFQHLGETDVQVIGQLRRGDRALTGFLLSLLQTSVSSRSWNTLPADLRRNGRLPHERLTVHVGHLLTIEVTAHYAAPGSAVIGPANPFVVRLFRNVGVVGGAPYEEIRPGGGDAAELSEAARREIVRRWLTGEPVDAELTHHSAAVRLMSAIYASLARRRAGANPLVSVPLPAAGVNTPPARRPPGRAAPDRPARRPAGRHG